MYLFSSLEELLLYLLRLREDLQEVHVAAVLPLQLLVDALQHVELQLIHILDIQALIQ